MITKEDVLKTSVECMNENKFVDYYDVSKKLKISDVELLRFLDELKEKGYIQTVLEGMYITNLGVSAYKELGFRKKSKNLIFNFSIVFLKFVAGIIGTVITAYIISYFGWQ